jgi:acetone carboxylase alpha subunit
MFFMGNGYMNSDWGLMGGYPSATGYRFEAHNTGLIGPGGRIEAGKEIPLGEDLNPDDRVWENLLGPDAEVKRDKQCITTEAMFDNGDLYLNYLRGGPGFGDPLDRLHTGAQSIEEDLNENYILPEYAKKIYGVVYTVDDEGTYHVDSAKTTAAQAKIKEDRKKRSVPVKEWMKTERQNILDNKASPQVKQMYASSFALSEPFLNEFKTFWDLPADYNLLESSLGIPMYGSTKTMDISEMPDTKPVIMTEE